MGKKTYTNYDDTLFGQYIRQLENPDSIGWDANAKIWRAPQGKDFDSRNRGMGVDILNNEAAIALTQSRPGKYLTEREENQLRNNHIQYLLDVIDRRKKNKNPALDNMSPKKQAQVLGILYRGDANELWNENSTLGKALNSKDDTAMDKAISEFYNLKGLGERARNDAAFWEDHSQQTKQNQQKTIITNAIQPSLNILAVPTDAIKSHRPIITPSTKRRDTYKAMQDKVNFNKFMDSISIQNNLPPAYNPQFNTHSNGGPINPADWSRLSMKDRANVMKIFLDKGISDLDTIRREYNTFASGGSIHIDPSKKGTFTAAASKHGMGVQEFASKVLANKEDYSPAMVKKANFARNSSKWHGLGGLLEI